MPSLVKMEQQCCGCTARLLFIKGVQEGVMKTFTFLIPTRYVVVCATTWDRSFGRFDKGTAEVLISLSTLLMLEDVKLCLSSLVRRLQ